MAPRTQPPGAVWSPRSTTPKGQTGSAPAARAGRRAPSADARTEGGEALPHRGLEAENTAEADHRRQKGESRETQSTKPHSPPAQGGVRRLPQPHPSEHFWGQRPGSFARCP